MLTRRAHRDKRLCYESSSIGPLRDVLDGCGQVVLENHQLSAAVAARAFRVVTESGLQVAAVSTPARVCACARARACLVCALVRVCEGGGGGRGATRIRVQVAAACVCAFASAGQGPLIVPSVKGVCVRAGVCPDECLRARACGGCR